MNERTVREFVEDLLSDGRSEEQIISVAKCTRWSSNLEEVKTILKDFPNFIKKGTKSSDSDDNIA